MKYSIFSFVLFLAVLCSPIQSVANTTEGLAIASWNIQHLGKSEKKDFAALGVVGGHFDLIAVQEVMTVEGLNQLVRSLEKATGVRWASMRSHAIGRGSYKEIYAFVWRRDSVAYVDGAVVYLDTGDRFSREPYAARFKDLTTGDTFVFANVHILYGKSEADRTPEIRELTAYWRWLTSTFPGEPIVLAGDFNLVPSHGAWTPLRNEGARPVVTRGATTLSSINGRYANLYDNLWVDSSFSGLVKSSGVLQFPAMLGVTHEHARARISDHAPVYLLTRKARLHTVPGAVR